MNISVTMLPSQAAVLCPTVSSSSLQKKGCGANYSHKWNSAVEYKAWSIDFQLSFHLKLRMAPHSFNSLDLLPWSHTSLYSTFTLHHVHLCSDLPPTVSAQKIRCLLQTLYQLCDQTKRRELLQRERRAWLLCLYSVTLSRFPLMSLSFICCTA